MADKLRAHGGVIVEFETFDPSRDVVSAFRHHTGYSAMDFDLKKTNGRGGPHRGVGSEEDHSIAGGPPPHGVYGGGSWPLAAVKRSPFHHTDNGTELDANMADKLRAHGGVIVEFETFNPSRDVVSVSRVILSYA
ncbi:hypothetical protein F4780DRAFT_749445 [Xylariomycetidae sp. FL0641]|nr:hypothetical protein F4780DRAFT_749445 [Xylariomycetidae sp. FL0641]